MTIVYEKEKFRIVIGQEGLDLNQAIKFVGSPKCGAINSFIGTIRDTDTRANSQDLLPIRGIFYEAYESMLMKQVSLIVESTLSEFMSDEQVLDSNCRAFVSIRTGLVEVGEAAIVICVSSTGRHISHESTMSLLQKIKSLATIWKKVIYSDGTEEWAGSDKSEAAWIHRR